MFGSINGSINGSVCGSMNGTGSNCSSRESLGLASIGSSAIMSIDEENCRNLDHLPLDKFDVKQANPFLSRPYTYKNFPSSENILQDITNTYQSHINKLNPSSKHHQLFQINSYSNLPSQMNAPSSLKSSNPVPLMKGKPQEEMIPFLQSNLTANQRKRKKAIDNNSIALNGADHAAKDSVTDVGINNNHDKDGKEKKPNITKKRKSKGISETQSAMDAMTNMNTSTCLNSSTEMICDNGAYRSHTHCYCVLGKICCYCRNIKQTEKEFDKTKK
jgi:hypothetical protein